MRCQPIIKSLVNICSLHDQSCLLCDDPSEQGYPLCSACEGELPWLHDRCERCALPLAMSGLQCADCRRRAPAFHAVEVPWRYAFPLDTLITRFKHQARWPLGRMLGERLAAWLQYRFEEGLPRPDRLLPVPMGHKRLRQRGFNQARMLADWLGRQLTLPGDDNLLIRTRETRAQQDLDAQARRHNLRQAFELASGRDVSGLHLALVDDVLTTGATCDHLARLLRQAGARRVDVYCLARTPRPGAP